MLRHMTPISVPAMSPVVLPSSFPTLVRGFLTAAKPKRGLPACQPKSTGTPEEGFQLASLGHQFHATSLSYDCGPAQAWHSPDSFSANQWAVGTPFPIRSEPQIW